MPDPAVLDSRRCLVGGAVASWSAQGATMKRGASGRPRSGGVRAAMALARWGARGRGGTGPAGGPRCLVGGKLYGDRGAIVESEAGGACGERASRAVIRIRRPGIETRLIDRFAGQDQKRRRFLQRADLAARIKRRRLRLRRACEKQEQQQRLHQANKDAIENHGANNGAAQATAPRCASLRQKQVEPAIPRLTRTGGASSVTQLRERERQRNVATVWPVRGELECLRDHRIDEHRPERSVLLSLDRGLLRAHSSARAAGGGASWRGRRRMSSIFSASCLGVKGLSR